jgi:outer membrane protein TolC
MDVSEKVRAAIRGRQRSTFATALLLLMPFAASAQISLSSAVSLAAKNSPAVRSARAEVDRAAASVAQARDAYFPSIVLGSSVGPPPYGFPLGNPDIYDVNAESLVFSFSQPDYVRAARSGLHAATLSLKDAEQQVALDVALGYVELDHDVKEIAALNEESGFAGSLVQIEADRVQAGVDPRTNELEAELTAAQVEEKRIELENDADLMRQKLGNLTGLPAIDLQTIPESIPSFPALPAGTPNDKQVADNSPGVGASYAVAESKLYTAFGDSRQNLRPSIGFGLKYQRFAQYQNFENYYHNFQQNNISAGVQLTIPVFDLSLKAKARQSAAEAARARADADASRDVLNEQMVSLRGNLRQLAAQQRVAQVQSQIAQEQLKTVETQLSSGTGLPNAPGVPPTQGQKAHIQERQYYTEMLEADLALVKAELNLMKVTGQIDAWVRSSLH